MSNIHKVLIAGAMALGAASIQAAEPGLQHFPALDTNRNGSLDWLETMQLAELRQSWSQLDRDADLQVDPLEFERYIYARGYDRVQVAMHPTPGLDEADANGDGQLNWLEANSVPALRGRWQQLDHNQDLRVDAGEYLQYRRNQHGI